MECTTTGPSAAVSASVSSSSPTLPAQDTSKPLRRKLQKARNNLRSGKRGSHDSSHSSPAIHSPTLECGGRPLATATTHIKSQVSCNRRPEPTPHIPMPTDLSDSKWLEYIESSGLMSSGSPDLPLGLGIRTKVNTEPSTSTLLPELANLSLSRTRSQSTSSRTSFDNFKSQSMSLLSPPSRPRKSISKRSLIAPGFKIGQLDGSQPRKKEIRVIKRKASIELIAEQYQAFLESRDAEEEDESENEDEQEEVLKPREPSAILLEPTRYDPTQATLSTHSASSPYSRQGSIDHARETIVHAPELAEHNTLSPGSDGTLVAFEEDAIYFKPISFSDSPASSPAPERSEFERRSLDKPLPKPPTSSEGSTPLQKSISMLVKELSSAMPQPTPQDQTQGLQISVMIEAYEKLRDQLDTSTMGDAESRSVRLMFDGWLAALHTMHRSFTRPSFSDRQAEDIAEPVD